MDEHITSQSLQPNENNDYKVVFKLYEYSEKCEIGYGGTAHHKGYIIFYKNYLSIEDHEVDRDDWDDAWHGNHTKYSIQEDKYSELINLLGIKYQCTNFECEKDENINIYNSLITGNEKILFGLLLSVINKKEGVMYGGELTILICKNNITYTKKISQYDDFYPDSDTLNYDKEEIVNIN
jgi:hypothetical protein